MYKLFHSKYKNTSCIVNVFMICQTKSTMCRPNYMNLQNMKRSIKIYFRVFLAFDSAVHFIEDGKLLATINDLNENPLFHITLIIRISLSTVICISCVSKVLAILLSKKIFSSK